MSSRSLARASLLATALMLITAPAPSRAAEPPPPGDAAGAPRPATVPAAGVVLAGVEVVAAPGLPVRTIHRAIGLAPGDVLTADLLAEVQARLAALPVVSRAELDLVPSPGGEVLRVTLARQPLIRSLEIGGTFPVFERSARSALKMRPGDRFEREKLAAEVESVARRMEKEGWYGSRCEAEVLPVVEGVRGDVDLRYRCERGSWLDLGEVRVDVTGDRPPHLSPAEIRDAVAPWLYFTRDDLDEEVAELVQGYREQGWVRARLEITAVEPDLERGVVDVSLALDEGKRLEVRIEGAEEISPSCLEDELPFVREGGYGHFLVEEGAEAIARSYQLEGYPEVRVRSRREESEDAVVVTYRVEEGPPLDLVGVALADPATVPASVITEDEVRDVIASGRRRWLVLPPRWDEELLGKDREAIAGLYRARGFADVAVEPAVPRRLGLLEDDAPDREVADEGAAPREGADPDAAGDGGASDELEAVFAIAPGTRWLVGDVSVEGGDPGQHTALLNAIPVRPGDPYVADQVWAGARAVGGELRDRGHLAASVKRVERRRGDPGPEGAPGDGASPGLVDVRYVVDPGPVHRASSVFAVGNFETRTGTVMRSLRVKAGNLVTPRALAGSEKDLRAFDLFDSVRVQPILRSRPQAREDARAETRTGLESPGAVPPSAGSPGPGSPDPGSRGSGSRGSAPPSPPPGAAPGDTPGGLAGDLAVEVPVVVRMREKKRYELDLTLAYNTDRGGSVRASVSDGNLFRRGRKLRLTGTYGERDRAAQITLEDPRLLGSRLRGTALARYSFQDLEAFDDEELRVAFGLVRTIPAIADPFRPTPLTARGEIAYRVSEITDVSSDDPDAPDEGVTRDVLLTLGLTHDSRDDLLYPSDGVLASVETVTSTRAWGSDSNFVRWDLRGRAYHSLVPGVVVAATASITDVEPFGSTEEVPSPELLFTGGSSSVRGFDEDHVGPLDADGDPLGGGSRVVAGLEVRFPLFWLLEGAAFTDVGSVVEDLGALTLDSFQPTVGGGLRLRSPVGPLRLDVGYLLEDEPEIDRWRLHFSFGYPF